MSTNTEGSTEHSAEPDRRAGTDTSLTTVAVEPTPAGRVRVTLDARGAPHRPVVRPMLLSSSRHGARVSLVPEGALLLAGDAIRIEVYVGPGTRLDLVEPGGTVAYDMRGGRASWDVVIDLAENAELFWHGEPFVCAAGSDVARTTTLTLGTGAVCALRETLVLGRHGEPGGRLRQRLISPMLQEDMALGHPMLLGGRRVMSSITMLGRRLSDGMQLEGDGTLLRALGDETHRVVPASAWSAVT